MVSLSSPSSPDPSAAANRSQSRSHLINTIFSYDGNVMLAAIISLLLVILFVLLLHFYAKCFLSSTSSRRSRRRRLRPPPSPNALSVRLQTLTRNTTLFSPASEGLDPSTISSIPLFVWRPGGGGEKDEECVVCLGGFEENDVGRRLPECGHGFHVDCIDTWLRSRASCPICREPVVANTRKETENKNKNSVAVAEDANSDDPAQESRDATAQEETGTSLTEIVIDIVPESGGTGNDNAGSPSAAAAARTQLPTTSLGSSLKRMLSRNRAETKIHPSSASPPSSGSINEPESSNALS